MSLRELEKRLRHANHLRAEARPGPGGERQPVHTVYGGAHLFRADVAPRMGARARAALDEFGLDAAALSSLLDVEPALAGRVLERVREKLATAPVEDYRIDFEDGYGVRPDEEEDGHARSAARALAEGRARGTLPPRIGLRIKPLGEESRPRAVRTLRVFLDALGESGGVPEGLIVTLPKATVPEQPAYLAALLAGAERTHGLRRGALGMELMVETPDALFTAGGAAALPALVAAGAGRVGAAHFGAYDYTAALGITAAAQRLRHPACDWARAAMQVQLAGTAVRLVDGATAVLPVPSHRGDSLDDRQRADNRAAVHHGWRLHMEDVGHALECGFHQGWDLHPHQLVSRHAAVYAFFLRSLEPAGARLRNFVERAAQATRVGTAFDDAATGQGLLNFFRSGLACGALRAAEVEAASGVAAEALAGRSFADLVGRS